MFSVIIWCGDLAYLNNHGISLLVTLTADPLLRQLWTDGMSVYGHTYLDHQFMAFLKKSDGSDGDKFW